MELKFLLYLFIGCIINTITCFLIMIGKTDKEKWIAMWLHVAAIIFYSWGSAYFVEK